MKKMMAFFITMTAALMLSACAQKNANMQAAPAADNAAPVATQAAPVKHRDYKGEER